ncbi:hypothetical protein C0W92_02725 [Photobacterium angustum]|uniref:Uncharacterized protein n=2 Tax=Photobacterium angustum TaxID=661 RepID=Q1ZX15_PHOAS|nr:hypothetical protein [Photobacterium angustum]KJF83610.1 hypothetical protein UB36_03545 [Photobacterium damselae subsp. damselae]EAS65545.1 hypothetical protein VAS14_09549 [Photobacterium angustum S14]KJF93894.1 hypothetical protein UB39_13055 [Photobacterium angustum]KJG02245.1 hypothetical protein UB35_08950 [Photobacterium angustum]KJG05064.1 hypothetical protein UB33_15495 [Photobacterium angustum]
MAQYSSHADIYTIARSALTKASKKLADDGFDTDLYCIDGRIRLVIDNNRHQPYEYALQLHKNTDNEQIHLEVMIKNNQQSYLVDGLSEPELIADVLSQYKRYRA